MALVHADFVRETTTTTGTGTLNLAGATTGCRTFASAIGNSNTCYYAIETSAGQFESGIGTVATGSPNTLARTTLIASSTGSKLDLPAGTHTVYCTFSAATTADFAPAAHKHTSEYDNGTLGATKTLDPTNGEFQKAVLGANCTVSLAAPPAGYGARISFRWTISGGPYEITWPNTGFRWLSGNKPLLSISSGRENLVVLSYTPTGWVAFGGSCVDINPVNLVPVDGSLLMTEDGIYWGVAQL